MTGRIFRAIMTAAGGVLLASLLIIFGCLYDYYGSVQRNQLWAELDMAAAGVECSGLTYLQSLDPDSSRLTWIAPNGDVRFDAHTDKSAMENHGNRAEVQQALAQGRGSSERYSSTLLEKTVYCACRLSDGSVLRISMRRATLAVLLLGMMQPICATLLAALLLALWLASRLSRRIVEPLNTLDLEHPLDNPAYDELSPLLRRISQQRGQIDAQLCQLRQKTQQFDQITSCMNEGLVLLDQQGMILSINPAAKRLLHTGDFALGRDFLTIERGQELRQTITEATEHGHGELTLEREGRACRIDASRIESDDTIIGVVLLIFDVTQRLDAERARQEFTANVSHELKTPLTGILGSSELLRSDMVAQEDVPRFVDHIHQEARRLLTLIEDILRLSQLDEGACLSTQRVNLADVAREVVEQLREQAAARQVTLELRCEDCLLQSEPRLLHEIVYNLTENAIKYNVQGGRVAVCVTAAGTLTVLDTGIGIPPEHQDRVFERFYRVDKSHSKAIGGTGLGLSIVKHAVACLGGSIALESQVGQGTTMRVTLPSQTSAQSLIN